MSSLINANIHIVVPIKNENEALNDFMVKYISVCKNYISDIIVTMIDDSDTNFQRYLIEDLGEPYNIKHKRGSGNYGHSLIYGINNAYNYDKLIVMDIDHPISKIPHMIALLDEHDVVIGTDLNSNLLRKVTGFLCNRILKLNLSHPTCGFIGFNARVFEDVLVSFAKSKRDIIHVEWMLMCRNKRKNIGELAFNTLGSGIKHNYTIKRYIRWLIDFTKTYLRDLFDMYP